MINKSYVIGIFAAICISLFVAMNYYREKAEKAENVRDKLESTISDMDQKLDTLQVRLNDSTKVHAAIVKNLNVTIKNLEDKYGKTLKELKHRPKDVSHYSETGLVIHDTVRTIAQVDSFGGMNARYADEWADISVAIDKTRNAVFDYSFKDSITIINVQKKHSILFGLIKWKTTEKTAVISNNPNGKITGFKSVNVISK